MILISNCQTYMLADKSHAQWIPCCLAGRGCHWVERISNCCCWGSSYRLRHAEGLRVVRNIILFASLHLGLLWRTTVVDLWSSGGPHINRSLPEPGTHILSARLWGSKLWWSPVSTFPSTGVEGSTGCPTLLQECSDLNSTSYDV